MEPKETKYSRTDLIVKDYYDDLNKEEQSELDALYSRSLAFREDLDYFQDLKAEGVDLRLDVETNERFKSRFMDRMATEHVTVPTRRRFLTPYLVAASVSILLLAIGWLSYNSHLSNQYEEILADAEQRTRLDALPLLPAIFKEDICTISSDPASFKEMDVAIQGHATRTSAIKVGKAYQITDSEDNSCKLNVLYLGQSPEYGQLYVLKGAMYEVNDLFGFSSWIFMERSREKLE